MPDGTWTRDPFPGNVIPANRIDPVARKVLELDPWVQPNVAGNFTNTGPTNNVLANEFARVFFNDYNLRIDHQVSQGFKLNGSYSENSLSGFQRPILFKEDRLDFDAAQGNFSPERRMNASIGYTWVMSPTLINDSRAGYFRRRTQLEVNSFGEDWASQLGIPNADPALMPSFGFNSSIQYEFTRNYLLEFSYHGSAGVGLIERWQANTFPIDYFAGNPSQQNTVFAAPQTVELRS